MGFPDVRSTIGPPKVSAFNRANGTPLVVNRTAGLGYVLDADDNVVNIAGIKTVKDYGAIGDGTRHPLSEFYGSLVSAQADYPHALSLTDEIDWAAWQKAINVFSAGRAATSAGAIFAPEGEYFINRPLVYGGASSYSLKIFGNCGGARAGFGTVFTWTGTVGESMFIFYGANECEVEGVNFNPESGVGLTQCVHVAADNHVNTTLSGGVTAGAVTATPVSMTDIAVGTLLGIDTGANFEVVYVTAVTGATFDATFTRAHSAGVQVGGGAGSAGVRFRRCTFLVPEGAATAGVLWGNKTAAETPQVSEGQISECYVRGGGTPGDSFAGFRIITGGNCKNFRFDNCNYANLKRGVSNEGAGTGTVNVTWPILNNITEYDFFSAGEGSFNIYGGESESATGHVLYYNISTQGMTTIQGFSWQVAAPSGDVIINTGGALTLIGNEFYNERSPGVSFPKVKVSNLGTVSGRSSVTSIGNWYENATNISSVFLDGSDNEYRYNLFAAGVNSRVFSVGDSGAATGTRLAPYIGHLTLGNAMLETTSTSSGITHDEIGLSCRTRHKVTIPYTAFQAAALSTDLTILRVPAKSRIVAVYSDTTTPFAGTAGTLNLRVGTNTGGQQLILDHDVKTAAVTKGIADADLGTELSRSGAVQGGVLSSWTITGDVKVRLTSGSGNLSGLNAGSVTVYVVAERL
jgi:hypothetical protein